MLEKLKSKKGIIIVVVLLLIVIGACSDEDVEEDKKEKVEVEEVDDGLRKELHPDEERLLKKDYIDFTDRERKLFDTLEKGNTISENLKKDIKNDVERLSKEKEVVLKDEKLQAEKDMEEYKKRQAKKEENKKEPEIEKNEEANPKEVRKGELRNKLKSLINSGSYHATVLNNITINENLGEGGEGTYIALVDLTFDIRNKPKTGNPIMKRQAADIAARLASSGVEDVKELAIFWKDDYNSRTVKYAFEYKDGAFYFMDIAGE